MLLQSLIVSLKGNTTSNQMTNMSAQVKYFNILTIKLNKNTNSENHTKDKYLLTNTTVVFTEISNT